MLFLSMWSSGLDRSFTNTGGAAEPVFQQGTWKSCITMGKVEMEQIGNTMKLLSVFLKEMAKIFENLKYEAWKMSFLLSKIGEIPIWWVADFTIQAPGREWEDLPSECNFQISETRHNLRTLFYSTAMGRENRYIVQHVFLYKWKFTKQNLNYEISDLCQESLLPVLPIMVLSITGVRKRTGPRPRWVWGEQLRSQMPTLKPRFIGRNRWCEDHRRLRSRLKKSKSRFLQVDIHMGCLNMFRLGLEIGLLILETIFQPRLPRSVFIWRWPGTLRCIIKPSILEVGRVKRGFACLSAAAGSLAAWGCLGGVALVVNLRWTNIVPEKWWLEFGIQDFFRKSATSKWL